MKKRNNQSVNYLKSVFLGLPYWIILLFLIIIPLIMMVLYSFQKPVSSNVFTIIFSFDNYSNFLSTGVFVAKLFESIYVALLVTLTCFVIGYPLALFISRQNFKLQVLSISLVSAPMVINLLIKVLSIKQLLDVTFPGILGTTSANIIGLTYIYLPFMVLPIYNTLIKIDDNLVQASYDLGANKFKTFYKVIFPLSITGVMSGVLMVLLPSATSLVVPKYLGKEMLIGNIIESAVLSRGQFGEGSAISIILSLIMLLLLLLISQINRIGVRRKRNEEKQLQNS